MTNDNLTLIAALLDRSGSMQDCKRATETGFDQLIAKQRTEPGEAVVTLSMFDDVYEELSWNLREQRDYLMAQARTKSPHSHG